MVRPSAAGSQDTERRGARLLLVMVKVSGVCGVTPFCDSASTLPSDSSGTIPRERSCSDSKPTIA